VIRFLASVLVSAVVSLPGSAQERLVPQFVASLNPAWHGDLDGMVDRGLIRFLLVYGDMFYFLDQGVQKGVGYELAMQFERFVQERSGSREVRVLVIPVTRDQLIPSLLSGHGDVAARILTITPGRSARVDFGEPFARNVSEIIVTGPASPQLRSLADLAGKEIHVRASSSHHEHLVAMNESLRTEGKEPIRLVAAPEVLDDNDLLQMLNAGLIPLVVVDQHIGEFWAQVFEDVKLRPDLPVHTGGQVAWAFRQDSPLLRSTVNDFVKSHRQGTLLGNILLKRYLGDGAWVRNALSKQHVERFRGMAPLFREYAERYRLDWHLVAAQAFQESGLDQSARSRAGAIGVMQLLPATARSVDIPDIEVLENNIHAGVKYLRHIEDRYFADPALDEMNRALLTLAAYNGGPTRIARLRRQTEAEGRDPNQWFDHVEVTVAREVGREPVQYVANIYKYYVAYRLISERDARKGAKPPAIP